MAAPSNGEMYDELGKRRKKRRIEPRTRNDGDSEPGEPEVDFSIQPLLRTIKPNAIEVPFEQIFEPMRAEFVHFRNQLLWRSADCDAQRHIIRPLSAYEIARNEREMRSRPSLNALERMFLTRLRKLSLRPHNDLDSRPLPIYYHEGAFNRNSLPREAGPDDGVIAHLNTIRRTLYQHSFASRICGAGKQPSVCWLRDWETRTTWMDLTEEIYLHNALRSTVDPEDVTYTAAAIEYGPLSLADISQVNQLLCSIFWDGINVQESLDIAPEKCTVVARYKKLVVGVALLSAPDETYLTYIAVRPGWDYAGIATCMLYLLISHNPGRDLLLHVSATNTAMMLYNTFGFKAEEYIIGFYDNYLPLDSKASKNAFRLRLRR